MKGKLEASVIQAAAPQRGLLTIWQLRRLGVGPDAIQAHLESGAWVRLQRGVYKLTPGPPDVDQRELAALYAAGPLAVLSHHTAGRRLKLDGVRSDLVHLTMPIPYKVQGLEGVKVWRTGELTEQHIVRRGPFRYTSIWRTMLDLAAAVDRETLRVAIDGSLRKNPAILNGLVRALSEHGAGHRGTTGLRALLEPYELDTPIPDSALESLAMELGFWTGRRPVMHHPLVPGRKRGPHLDFAWPEVKFGVELDGFLFHSGLGPFHGDRRKGRKAFFLGWGVLHFTWRDLRREPQAFIQEVAAGYALCAGAASPKQSVPPLSDATAA